MRRKIRPPNPFHVCTLSGLAFINSEYSERWMISMLTNILNNWYYQWIYICKHKKLFTIAGDWSNLKRKTVHKYTVINQTHYFMTDQFPRHFLHFLLWIFMFIYIFESFSAPVLFQQKPMIKNEFAQTSQPSK